MLRVVHDLAKTRSCRFGMLHYISARFLCLIKMHYRDLRSYFEMLHHAVAAFCTARLPTKICDLYPVPCRTLCSTSLGRMIIQRREPV